jgi:hypothetical protein
MQLPPKLKRAADPKVATGTSEPFSHKPVKKVRTIETVSSPVKARENFTKRVFLHTAEDSPDVKANKSSIGKARADRTQMRQWSKEMMAKGKGK